MTPIALVFDELKDYLSESDLSLDYKIARSRNKKKKLLTNRNSKIFNGEVNPTNPQQGENQKLKKSTKLSKSCLKHDSFCLCLFCWPIMSKNLQFHFVDKSHQKVVGQ